jgi:hypothetical protein
MNITDIKTNLTAFSMAILFCFCISTARGQEMTFDVNNSTVPTEKEENLEGESQNTNLSETKYGTVDLIETDGMKREKQPTYTNTAPKIEEQKTNKESASGNTKTVGTNESESVLSFNFLYYIIQKFKFTEITDQ